MLSVTLTGLFFASFLAATLVPTASEVIFAQLIIEQPQYVLWLWLAASLGNSLGGAVTYFMGVGVTKITLASTGFGQVGLHNFRSFMHKRNLVPKKPSASTLQRIEKLGIWVLLLSWLPIIGDLLCLAAGILQWPKTKALCLIALGKFARYGGLALWLMP